MASIRRRFAISIGCLAAGRLLTGSAFGARPQDLQTFDADVAGLAGDQAIIDESRSFRELQYRQVGPSDAELLAQPNLSRRYASAKIISDRASGLIVLFEVSSAAVYQAKYRSPTWPKGQSGVTIGIGYDLGYVDKTELNYNWGHLLQADAIERLSQVCGRKGDQAADLAEFVQDIVIPWSAASAQFKTILGQVGGETISAFPGAETLSADSFGALVSLVYNRGGAMNSAPGDPLDRRREMRAIRGFIQARSLDQVSDQIKAMRRLWINDRNAAGLVKRRELEAELFSAGL